jgi:hypothetical protein
MIKRFDNVKLNIDKPESALIDYCSKQLGAKVKYFKILKKSLDARDKGNIYWLYSVACSAQEEEEQTPVPEKVDGRAKIAIIGSGPAGLMCAIRLVEHGFKPIIFERGECVEERKVTCENFYNTRVLNEQSNVQFGEGGAGTFSDGKLNTQTKDGLNKDVLKLFAAFGAPQEIVYLNKPHIGSDKLYYVLQNIRKFITQNGGEFAFNSQVTGLIKDGDTLKGLIIKNVKSGKQSEYMCDSAVLAVGHSARDTFEMLSQSGAAMEAKDFAIGVRIEHLAANIGFAQYGKNYIKLPTADYKLVSHAHELTVFTFCMCPGGVVIPAASESGGVVVNGMSLYARDNANSNSALMVQMRRSDFGADDLFAGMRYQRMIENKAYESGGRCYKAPIQLYKDFAKDKVSSSFGAVKPTYAAGTTFAPLNEVLPKVAVEALKAAIPDMNKRLKGFASPDALLSGVETRFSSPVKIIRGDDLQSVTIKNLYPCGEGSGYSGGITSSAADGLKIAETLFDRFKEN